MTKSIRIGAKRSGAWLVRHALEQLPVTHTLGIPGVHNTEIYDELNRSEKIQPVLVTHEGGAAFAADGISRTSGGTIGTLVIVPAAGVTHAMSGIGEAFLDGIPMLVISGGIRTDVPFRYQLHELDQRALLQGLTKGSWRPRTHVEIVPAIFEAYRTAVTGVPGPVLVEIPVNLQLFQETIDELPVFEPPAPPAGPDARLVEAAVDLLEKARSPGLFVGWGAVDVVDGLARIAECLGAPVATTLQGLSAFSAAHPLHAGMGFSRAAVPAAENAFADCDCLFAVGTRFAEIPTGSFGCRVPEDLIHVDIDPAVLGANFPARVAIAGDARAVVPRLLALLAERGVQRPERRREVEARIRSDKAAYREEWLARKTERVNPARFFESLRHQLRDDALMVVDDGNHTFLAAELFPVTSPRRFVSPTDFNCMGYAVPAAIGAKLARPDLEVVAIAGDGAFLMTGLEIVTATTHQAGVVFFVFHDGELSQISQGQEIPYNRKTCTVLGEIRLEGVAQATGAAFLAIPDDAGIDGVVREALRIAGTGRPVVVDVRIDYGKRTRFTRGVVKTVLKRFPLGDKFRFVGRAFVRKLTG
ncbi:MAG: thiamine pyrophosphate-binding protein [Acidobacteriota bacterium]